VGHSKLTNVREYCTCNNNTNIATEIRSFVANTYMPEMYTTASLRDVYSPVNWGSAGEQEEMMAMPPIFET